MKFRTPEPRYLFMQFMLGRFRIIEHGFAFQCGSGLTNLAAFSMLFKFDAMQNHRTLLHGSMQFRTIEIALSCNAVQDSKNVAGAKKRAFGGNLVLYARPGSCVKCAWLKCVGSVCLKENSLTYRIYLRLVSILCIC